MGAELVKAVCSNPAATLAAAIARPGSAAQGKDAGVLSGRSATGVTVTADIKAALASLDVVIDFSRAEAVATALAAGLVPPIEAATRRPATERGLPCLSRLLERELEPVAIGPLTPTERNGGRLWRVSSGACRRLA